MVELLQRLTAVARHTLDQATFLAEQGQADFVYTEHLLLALVEEQGIAGRALHIYGLNYKSIQAQIEAMFGNRERVDVLSRPFADVVIQVIQNAIKEAERLGHLTVGTPFLLLGLLRHPGNAAKQILVQLDVQPEELQGMIEAALSPKFIKFAKATRRRGGSVYPKSPALMTSKAALVMIRALEAADILEQPVVNIEHLLLALLSVEGNRALVVLRSLGLVQVLVNQLSQSHPEIIFRQTLQALQLFNFIQQKAYEKGRTYIGTKDILTAIVHYARQNIFEETARPLHREPPKAEPVATPAPDRLSAMAQLALQMAVEEAERLEHNIVDTEHLLLALMRVQGTAEQALFAVGVEIERVRSTIEQMSYPAPEVRRGRLKLAPELRDVLLQSFNEARALKSPLIGTGHFMLAIVRLSQCKAALILHDFNLFPDQLERAVVRTFRQETD